jgi:ribosomal protein L37E
MAAKFVPATPSPIVRMGLTQEQKDHIAARLEERGVNAPCPRCGNMDFAVEDGVFKNLIYSVSEFPPATPTMTSVPTAVTTCQRCGFVSEHALGTLGFLHNGIVTI